MKLLILAALAIAAPAAAQTAPDAAQAAPENAPVTPAPPTTAPDVTSTPTTTPIGGYGPANTQAAVPPGATVVYRQAPTPDQAYPAPAPLAKYPICKKGQYDKCLQRGSR